MHVDTTVALSNMNIDYCRPMAINNTIFRFLVCECEIMKLLWICANFPVFIIIHGMLEL